MGLWISSLDSLWVIDRIFHDVGILDPMTLLTCAAAVTSRIRLGTSVLLFVFRNPILLAKTTATLDCLSDKNAGTPYYLYRFLR